MSKYVVHSIPWSIWSSMHGDLNGLCNFRGLSPVDVHVLGVVYWLLYRYLHVVLGKHLQLLQAIYVCAIAQFCIAGKGSFGPAHVM